MVANCFYFQKCSKRALILLKGSKPVEQKNLLPKKPCEKKYKILVGFFFSYN